MAWTTVKDLEAEIEALESMELLVETNQGTYGATEAMRKVGCGDPYFATRNVYETVGGRRREAGPGAGEHPGYMRSINRPQLADLRKRLADLRKQLRASR